MFVQLNKCVVVCGSVLQRGHSGDGCLTSLILFKYEHSRGHLFVLSWARVRRVARGGVLFRSDVSELFAETIRNMFGCGCYFVMDLLSVAGGAL